MKNFAYSERGEKLNIRIHAHVAYANFQLEGWISGWLSNAEGYRLLEMGCGDGNFFPTYSQVLGGKGLIIGCDISDDLLHKARARTKQLATLAIVFRWDFDIHPYPFLDEEVDVLVAPFCAYYTDNVPEWIEDSLRLVKKGGKLLLLGPTQNNAEELYKLNEMVTGLRSVPETDETSIKLENAFFPQFQKRSECETRKTILDRQIVFPSPEDFANYYFSTWLYEKTQEKIGARIERDSVVRAARRTSLKLNKQVVCIEVFKT